MRNKLDKQLAVPNAEPNRGNAGKFWTIVLIIVILSYAKQVSGETLPPLLSKPTWSICTESPEVACMNLEQVRHLVLIYQDYVETRTKFRLLDERLALFEEANIELERQTDNLSQALNVSTIEIANLRKSLVEDSDITFSTLEFTITLTGVVLLSFLSGVGIGFLAF